MEDFTEMDEIQRFSDEANKVQVELNHLIFLRSSGNHDFNNIDFLISKKANELKELRFKIEIVKLEMGDGYDRYKNNKRK